LANQHGRTLRVACRQKVYRLPSADECARMERNGYLVARGLLDADQVAEVLRWTTELAEAPESSGRHWVYREGSLTAPGQRLIQRIENFCPYHERLDAFARNGCLADWTGVLMGAPMVLFKDKINFKMPGAGGFKAHQDQQAGWSRYAPIFVTAMLTLDAATLENGCLEIATDRRYTQLIGKQWTPLEENTLQLQPLPTAPGM
jgi:2-aminoethylphosphonate dioxygenase